ncbi:MAG TPA: hypothetical protein VF137_00935 [Candidatus Dormibacteraeota bacterium]
MSESVHEAWIVETSKDGERWRFFGKAWVLPGERLLIHGLPRYVRVRRNDQPDFGDVLPRTGPQPMALIDLEHGTRSEIWPGADHHGMPVLLPGGEVGRLLKFDHSADEEEWTWALEFRGSRADLPPGALS